MLDAKVVNIVLNGCLIDFCILIKLVIGKISDQVVQVGINHFRFLVDG